MFVVDTSSEINKEQFKKVKEFIRSVSYSFVVSKANTQVGVVTYGHYATPEITFRTGNNLKQLSAAITNLGTQRRGDKLHAGMRIARKLLFESKGRK